MQQSTADIHVARGRSLHAAGDYAAAISELNVALTVDPKCLNALILLGNCHLANSDHEKALRCYDEALRISPSNLHALTRRATLLYAEGHVAALANLSAVVLKIAPKSVTALIGLGDYHLINKNWDQAIHYYSQALEQFPYNSHALAGLNTAQQSKTAEDVPRNQCIPEVAYIPEIDPTWLTWNNSTVVKLARTICDENRLDIIPILGDALEDAGCTDQLLLDHCRKPGSHIDGCWVLKLILGEL